MLISAWYGQPMWLIHSDSTRLPLNGSYVHGATSVSLGGGTAATPMLTNAKNMAKTANVVRRMNPSLSPMDALVRVHTNHPRARAMANEPEPAARAQT